MTDSAEVQALKAGRSKVRGDGDWGAHMAKRYSAMIRAQRLLEARNKGTHTDSEWSAILTKFDYRCVQCGCLPVGRPCKDHIKPIYQGGSDGIDNLQPLCRECNTSKGPDSFNWAAYREVYGFDAEGADA